jgi:hypothetical protein
MIRSLFSPTRRRIKRQRTAALAGGKVNLVEALSEPVYAELSALLTATACDERDHMVDELARYAGVVRPAVTAITRSCRQEEMRLWLDDGRYVLLAGISLYDSDMLRRAVRHELRVIGAEALNQRGAPVRLRWTVSGSPAYTIVSRASLMQPNAHGSEIQES